MEKDLHKTKVIFVKSKEEKEIIAFFPEIKHDNLNKTCYTHIGQHSACAIDYIKSDCIQANPAEYADLKHELEILVGYNLQVLTLIDLAI